MADRRVVVTGMGITSCLGNTLDDVRDSLRDCKVGIEFDQEWADLGIKSQVRGRPALTDDDFKERIPKAKLRFMGANAKYAYLAMTDAVEHAQLAPEDYEENPRVCAILGQGGTSIPDIMETVNAVKAGGRWKNKVSRASRAGVGEGWSATLCHRRCQVSSIEAAGCALVPMRVSPLFVRCSILHLFRRTHLA